jgi:hypothetical protein
MPLGSNWQLKAISSNDTTSLSCCLCFDPMRYVELQLLFGRKSESEVGVALS